MAVFTSKHVQESILIHLYLPLNLLLATGLTIEFIPLAIEFIPLAIEFVALP